MKALYGLIAICLIVSLTACSEEASEVKDSAPAAKTEDSASKPEPTPAPAAQTEAPAAGSTPAPAATKTPPAQPPEENAAAGSEVAPGTPSKDEQVCLQAVSTETNNADVVTLSVEESEANTLVMVGVGPNRAPWKCLAKDGVVAEVMSMTDEGAL